MTKEATLVLETCDNRRLRVALTSDLAQNCVEGTISALGVERLSTKWLCDRGPLQSDLLLPKRIQTFGSALTKLLPDAVRAELARIVQCTVADRHDLRIALSLNSPVAADLPWELLRFGTSEDMTDFVALHPHVLLARREGSESSFDREIERPVRVLVAHANPATQDFPHLPWVDREVLEVVQLLRESPGFEVRCLPNVVPAVLEGAIREVRPHILYFAGHGTAPHSGAALVLQGQDRGNRSLYFADRLIACLSGIDTRLVVLSACETTVFAEEIARNGIPAVLAMQSGLRDTTASAFLCEFLRRLRAGAMVDVAAAAARHQIIHSGGWWVPTLNLSCEAFRMVSPPASQEQEADDCPKFDTSFIGRKRELAEVRQLIRTEHYRQLTVTGIGGIGKTRFSCECGRLLGRYFDLSVYLDCGTLRNQEDFFPHLANSLKCAMDGAPKDSVKEALKSRSCLLILDGGEKLIDDIAAPLDELLEVVPGLTLIVASRFPLGIRGENLHPLEPLQVSSDPEVETEGMALFTEAVRNFDPSFTLTGRTRQIVSKLCCRSEGIPLAIRIAAGWLRMTGLQDLERIADDSILDSDTVLSQVIRDTIGLLSATDAEFLQRLTVFAGSFTLEDASEVLGLSRSEAMKRLHLLSFSVLQKTNVGGIVRYSLLDTVREFVDSLIISEENEQVLIEDRLRLSNRCAEIARKIAGDVQQGKWSEPSKVFWSNIANIRVAVTYSIGNHFHSEIATFVEALSRFYLESGLWNDLDELALAGHRTADVLGQPRLHVLLYGLEGALWARRKDSEKCLRLWLQRAAICEEIGDETTLTDTLVDVGCHLYTAKDERAIIYFRRALPLAQKTGQPELIGTIYAILGHMAADRKETKKALRWADKAAKVLAENGNSDLLLFVSTSLGKLFMKCDLPVRAAHHLWWSLTTASKGDRLYHIADASLHLALVFETTGQDELCVRCIVAAEKLNREIRSKWREETTEAYQRTKSRLTGTVYETLFEELRDLSWRQIVQHLISLTR